MDSLRNTIFNVVFLWVGIIVTAATLDGVPKADWTSTAIRLGLLCTIGVLLVAAADVVIRRRSGTDKRKASSQND